MSRSSTASKKHASAPQPVQQDASQGQGTLQIDISDLLDSPRNTPRIVFLAGDVSEESIAGVIAQLLLLASSDPIAPIHLIISTYGGSSHEMFALYDVIKWLPCPVHTVGLGKIMSAGVLLLASGQKGERLIGEHSRVMLHNVHAVFGGNVLTMKNEMTELDTIQSAMERCLAKEVRKDIKVIKQIMSRGQDHYLTAQDAIKLGLADQILGEATKFKVG